MVYYLVKKTENELVLQLLSNVKVSTKKRKNVKKWFTRLATKPFNTTTLSNLKGSAKNISDFLFLKWQPCHFPVIVICFVYVNIPKVLLIFFNKLFICSMPYFNYHLFSIEDSLALALNSSGLFTYLHDKHIRF